MKIDLVRASIAMYRAAFAEKSIGLDIDYYATVRGGTRNGVRVKDNEGMLQVYCHNFKTRDNNELAALRATWTLLYDNEPAMITFKGGES